EVRPIRPNASGMPTRSVGLPKSRIAVPRECEVRGERSGTIRNTRRRIPPCSAREQQSCRDDEGDHEDPSEREPVQVLAERATAAAPGRRAEMKNAREQQRLSTSVAVVSIARGRQAIEERVDA